MPPAIESQTLRGVTSRKRILPAKKCTVAKTITARSETTMMALIASRHPPRGVP